MMMDSTPYNGIYDLSFPPSFFEDEARDGFFVCGMMKRFWAAQLMVLSEVASVCRTLDIPWFMDFGTLLGAVRHNGYIPWDDDLDICMFRHDMDRFIAHAKRLLPPGYLVNNIMEDVTYENNILRVQNTDSIDMNDGHMQTFFGCPYVAGIDIFAIDGLYKDSVEEAHRRKRLKDTFYAASLVSQGLQSTDVCNCMLETIERENHISLPRDKTLYAHLLRHQVYISREVPSDHAKRVAKFYNADHIWAFPAEYFHEAKPLPFENMLLPAPVACHEVLTAYFGNYHIISRSGADHDYPVWDRQEDKLRALTGGNPYRYELRK
ncbi:MAG: LicD family protein [Lachnospiraceae bacterium]|nr:LicD family protein [Lachnospiraceae bacterium]